MDNPTTRDLYAELMLKARERGIEYPLLRESESGSLVIEDTLTGHQYGIKLVRTNETAPAARAK